MASPTNGVHNGLRKKDELLSFQKELLGSWLPLSGELFVSVECVLSDAEPGFGFGEKKLGRNKGTSAPFVQCGQLPENFQGP